MANRRNLITERVMGLLTNEWVTVEDLMDLSIPLVPPGKALRRYALEAEHNARERNKRIEEGRATLPQRPPLDEAERVVIGARAIINDIIRSGRDNHTIDVLVGDTRYDRKVRLSAERRFSHHCCLHGGTCRGDESDVPGSPDPAITPVLNPPELSDDPVLDDDDPLLTLIQKVLTSRERRTGETWPSARPVIREVKPGEIDRLLAECG